VTGLVEDGVLMVRKDDVGALQIHADEVGVLRVDAEEVGAPGRTRRRPDWCRSRSRTPST
jgi:hypothetical protein